MELTTIIKSKSNQEKWIAPVFLTQLLAYSIPFPIRLNAYVAICAAVFYVVYAIINRNFDRGLFKAPLFIFVAILFLVQLLGLLHSPDLTHGYADIERFAFVFIFVVLLFQLKDSGVSVFSLIVSFLLGCVSLTLYGFGYALFVLDAPQQKTVFELGHVYFTEAILIHPTYLSIYLIFIFFFLLETGRANYSKFGKGRKAAVLSLLVYSGLMIFFLRSQIGLLIFVLLSMIYPVIVFKRRASLVTFFLVAIGLLVYLMDADRVSTFFDSYGRNVSSALDNRFKLWKGVMEAIIMEPLFGAGTGGEQILLNQGYAKTGYQEGISNSYNAHNQYFEFLVRNGIVELTCFMALLVYSFKQALRKPNYTFLLFNMIFTLGLIAESCLNVHKGIVFFYFFLCAFVFLPYASPSGVIKE